MSKVEALAKLWTHGIDGAQKRLREMLEEGHRFDARDRQALAYLLAQPEPALQDLATTLPDAIAKLLRKRKP
jgi:hypothetical protein